jgi:cobalt/nickel transport system permease protein
MSVDESFAGGASALHRLDPRVKWIAAVAFSVVVAASQSLPAAAAGLAFGAGLTLLTALPLRVVAVRLALVNVFLVALWIFLPFAGGGEVLARVGPWDVREGGLGLAALITLKSNAILLVLVALPGTSTVFDNIHALHHLRLPSKLVHLLFFTFRYIHVIHEEYRRLRNAMKVRCFRARTDRHTYRSLAHLLGMLLVRSFERSERVHAAMLCRGFKGTLYTLHHFTLRPRDVGWGIVLGICILGIAGIAWLSTGT